MLKITWGEVLGSVKLGEDFKIMLKIIWGEVLGSVKLGGVF